MLCTIRKTATAASVTRIIDPANTAEPEKTRSPGRCFALMAVVAVLIWRDPRVQVIRMGDAAVPDPDAFSTNLRGRARTYYWIESIAAVICSRRVSEIGAEPAASAATSWPSGLAMYEKYDFTSSTFSASAYCWQPMM